MNQDDTVRIALIGDIFPGELPFTQNYGIRTQFKKHKGMPLVNKIKNITGENDIVIGNLESPLVSERDVTNNVFFGDPEFATFLKECGINVLNIANNHILEHGAQGFQSTIQVLNKTGLAIIGLNSYSKSKIFYKEIKGLKIAIAGFSNVDLHVIKNDGHFPLLNENNVLSTLKAMNELRADLKILSFHWGNEYVHVPSFEQRRIAYKFIDNGADVIVGHHPHVIQPYEEYRNGHIFYSLGNFIFDFIHSKMFSVGLVAKLEVNHNRQIHVNLSGVKLSYKNTITSLPSVKFEKYYSMIKILNDEFIGLTDDEYKSHYQSLYKRNHFWQRIVMKTYTINEFLRIRTGDKIFLVKNLFAYYSKLFNEAVNKKVAT